MSLERYIQRDSGDRSHIWGRGLDEQLSGRFMYRDLKLGLFSGLESNFPILQTAYTYRETAIP
jgi:hypothetical protein